MRLYNIYLITAVAASFYLTAAGCMHLTRRTVKMFKPHNVYVAKHFDWSGMRRVALAVLTNESEHPRAIDSLRANLAAELQAAGLFEVVVLPPRQVRDLSLKVRRSGRYDESVLVELHRRYNVDGLLVGTLTQYRPYRPMKIGVVLHLISINEATPVASIDALWDMRNRRVAQAARAYAQKHLKDCENPASAELIIHSPDLFQRFVCRQIAESWSVIHKLRRAQFVPAN